MKIAHKIVQVPEMKFLLRPFIHNVKRNNQNIHEIFQEKSHVYFRSLIRFCPVSYTHLDLYKRQIQYSKEPADMVADSYTQKLWAELGNEDATIINLSIDDASVQKAEDILNTLIEVYNEKWIQDKNQIAVSTSRFIGERLGVIENELGHVDENISSYKSEHLLPDVQAASNLYMSQSAENKKEIQALTNQLTTAQYLSLIHIFMFSR